ncbi:hypothetical protein PHMEG_0007849 [Phytophthora megakarya]|uniref:Uncharacterized protein n=1 Tax=Phytophthora megakarya TaxID=4795 RepID=A0A225WK52_9STRA|nr:hypothetical protein PHMEG_0007849 [Phytophthora megakarya]
MELSGSRRNKKVITSYQRALGQERAKRHYYNKLKLRDDLQRQVEQLEAQYDQLVRTMFGNKERQNQTSCLHRMYVELAQVKRTLTQENTELERLKANYLTVEKKILQLSTTESKRFSTLIQEQTDRRRNPQLKLGRLKANYLTGEKKILQLSTTESKRISTLIQEQTNRRRNPQLKVNLLTSDQFYDLMAESFLEIKEFRESKNCSSTGMDVFGWRDRHIFNQDKVAFSLNKVFHGQELEKIMGGLWPALLQPEIMVKMHPSNAKRLDEEAVVYYYTHERDEGAVRVRAFVLVMRLNLGPEGYVIVFRTLNPKTYLQQDEGFPSSGRRLKASHGEHVPVIWLNSFVWSFYEYVGNQKNDFRYTTGGEIQGNALTSANWWYIEMLRAAMDFETQVIGSRGLLRL